jgi:hypothetical protein
MVAPLVNSGDSTGAASAAGFALGFFVEILAIIKLVGLAGFQFPDSQVLSFTPWTARSRKSSNWIIINRAFEAIQWQPQYGKGNFAVNSPRAWRTLALMSNPIFVVRFPFWRVL